MRTPKPETSDDDCVGQLARGREDYFEILFDRHSSFVMGLLMRMTGGDRPKSEDISQQVWISVIRAASRYKSQGTFRAWLGTIVRNTALKAMRSDRFFDVLEDNGAEIAGSENVLEVLESIEDQKMLTAAIDALPDNQRLVLVAWMSGDSSYQQLCDELKCSLASVKSLLFRARENLKRILANEVG